MPFDFDLRAEVKKWLSPAKVFMTIWSIILLLITTGWIMIPAKSSDVTAVISRVGQLEASVEKTANRVETALDKLSLKVDKLQADQIHSREEIIRLGAGRKVAEAFTAEPSAARAVRPKAKKKKGRPPRPVSAKRAEKESGWLIQ